MPSFPDINPEQWSAFGTMLTAWATLGLALFALLGLRQWREQLKGTNKYDIARRLALLAFQFKDQFDYARSPLTIGSESADRPQEKDETREEAQVSNEYYARFKRIEPLHETIQKLKLTAWEAEVILGSDVKGYIKKIFDIYHDYRVSFDIYFEDRYSDLRRSAGIPRDQEEINERRDYRRKVYYSGSQDPLYQSADEASQQLIQYLGKFVK